MFDLPSSNQSPSTPPAPPSPPSFWQKLPAAARWGIIGAGGGTVLICACLAILLVIGSRAQRTATQPTSAAPRVATVTGQVSASLATEAPNVTTVPTDEPTVAPTDAPTNTPEPTPTDVPTVVPQPTDVPVAAVSADEQAYLASAANSMGTFGTAMGEMGKLLQKFQFSAAWLASFDEQLEAMQQSNMELLKLTPPQRFAEEHTQMISATSGCVSTTQAVRGAIQVVDTKKMQALLPSMSKCTSELTAASVAFQEEGAK